MTRPGRWGNPYRGPDAAERFSRFMMARSDATYVADWVRAEPPEVQAYPTDAEIQAELAGKILACWCALGVLCHADVLLMIANRRGPWQSPAPQIVYGPHCHHDECSWLHCDIDEKYEFPCNDQATCPHCGPVEEPCPATR